MKKISLILVMLTCLEVSSQTYVSGSFSYYNGVGTFSQNGMASLEVGTVVGNKASVGIAGGITSFSSSGNPFIEFRPTLTVWNYGNISLAGTLGAGYVFNTEEILTEYCGTMSYSIGDNTSISIFGGGYWFNGRMIANKYTFVGTGLTFTIPKNKSKGMKLVCFSTRY